MHELLKFIFWEIYMKKIFLKVVCLNFYPEECQHSAVTFTQHPMLNMAWHVGSQNSAGRKLVLRDQSYLVYTVFWENSIPILNL